MSLSVFGNATEVAAGVLAKQNLYADMILEPIKDVLLAPMISVDYSADFKKNMGGTLRIPSIGDVGLFDHIDEDEFKFEVVDLGNVTLNVTKFKQAGHRITRAQLENGYLVERALDQLVGLHQRAILEGFETDLLQAANDGQTAGNANNIKGAAHRLVAQGASNAVVLEDLQKVVHAFRKANMGGDPILGIVTPEVIQDLETIPNLVNGGIVHPHFERILSEGLIRNMAGVASIPIYNMTLVANNRLPDIASETIGSDTVTNGKANIFLNVSGNPQHMALAHMWGRMPDYRMWVEEKSESILHATTARYGVGTVRGDGVVVLLGR